MAENWTRAYPHHLSDADTGGKNIGHRSAASTMSMGIAIWFACPPMNVWRDAAD